MKKFDFKHLLTPEELSAGISSNDVSYISVDEERYPTIYLDQYKNKLKEILEFNILDEVCYSNTEIILICGNVGEHNDRRDSVPEQIYFLNTMLKGKGIFKIHHTDEIIQKVTLKEGDVFLFDPNINHSFENTSNELCYMYSLSITLNKKDKENAK